MRKIKVLAVGAKPKDYIGEGISKFEKKIRRYCDLELQWIKEANYSSGDPAVWLDIESQRIEKRLSKESVKIACDEKGKQLTSVDFSMEFEKWATKGFSSFDFIVGGAYGLHDRIKQSAQLILSFSPMTMTHQMFRLFLIEQIYRAFTIINGEKYHH